MPSEMLLAATVPGEIDILSTVVSNLNDDTAKLVYADWLEDRNDPGGTFIRKFVEAVRNKKDVPDIVGYNDAWHSLVGYSLADLIHGAGVDNHGTAIRKLAKPSVGIRPLTQLKKCPIGATKLSGLPSLPVGTKWPRCEKGPLEFLAQFDLTELHQTVAGRALPRSGLLSFFMYHNYPEDEYGVGRGRDPIEGGLRVIHTPPGAKLTSLRPPSDLTQDLGFPRAPYRVQLTDFLDIPDPSGLWAKSYPTRFVEALAEEGYPGRPATPHQLFGYSHVTVLAEDPTPGPEWEQLIRFSSDRKLNWGWGDGHHLFWYIRSDDLRAGRFDRTVAIDG